MPNYIPKEDWPPNSPDLSLIKNLWAIIDKCVKSLNPSSQAAMWTFIFDEWKSIVIDEVKEEPIVIDEVKEEIKAEEAWAG